jgi:hypothetical protein
MEYLAELRWDDAKSLPPKFVATEPPGVAIGIEDFPVDRGDPTSPRILAYMRSEEQVPIMTNSESILRFGNNAYGKPATALSILRKSLMGPTQADSVENFTYAFRQYARRWEFRHPNPADFFRTMEDASGIDLDWFWRGWFYTTDHVDLAVSNVQTWKVPAGERLTRARAVERVRAEVPPRKPEIQLREPGAERAIRVEDGQADDAELQRALRTMGPAEAAAGKYYSIIEIHNLGGLVMPVLLSLDDGESIRTLRIPAEIWRQNNQVVRKLVFTNRPLREVILDRERETADVDSENNVFPRVTTPSRVRSFRERAESPGRAKSRD